MRKKIYLIILTLVLAVTSTLFAGCGGGSALPNVNSDEDRMITQQVTVPPTEYNAKKAVYATIGRLSKYSTYSDEQRNVRRGGFGAVRLRSENRLRYD